MSKDHPTTPENDPAAEGSAAEPDATEQAEVPEVGGRKGPDPTRYGDWEKNGRCIDF